jgi:hypothetical protein
MNDDFWGRVGLLLFLLGTIGWFTDFSVLALRWIYLLMIAMGTLLYLEPAKYYTKTKEKNKSKEEFK